MERKIIEINYNCGDLSDCIQIDDTKEISRARKNLILRLINDKHVSSQPNTRRLKLQYPHILGKIIFVYMTETIRAYLAK